MVSVKKTNMTDAARKGKLPKIVCIGGGTGTFVTLKGLKHHPCSLSAIVAMSDSGGSNKRIRDEFGLLPTSDIRQCLVALSEENGGVGLLRQLFMYRFEKGQGITGMTFGNLFMAALTDILGSQKEAIQQTGKVLKIRGTVIPVSYTDTNLMAEYENGTVLTEEHFIDEPPHDGRMRIKRIWLEPQAEGNPDAVKAIREADLIVVGPGDLYTSVLPNFLVSGIAEAVAKAKGKKAYVMNLMTKWGQTYGYTAGDHIRALEDATQAKFDYVLINTSEFSEKARQIYAESQEFPVADDLPKSAHYTIIRKDMVSSQLFSKTSSDALVRSLIRHDSEKLAAELIKLV